MISRRGLFRALFASPLLGLAKPAAAFPATVDPDAVRLGRSISWDPTGVILVSDERDQVIVYDENAGGPVLIRVS